MSSVQVFSLVLSAIFVIWAVLVLLFGGEKYMRWYYQFRHVDRYDIKKFKIVHTIFLFIAAVCIFLFGFWDTERRFFILMAFILSSILQYVLIYTVCKKK